MDTTIVTRPELAHDSPAWRRAFGPVRPATPTPHLPESVLDARPGSLVALAHGRYRAATRRTEAAYQASGTGEAEAERRAAWRAGTAPAGTPHPDSPGRPVGDGRPVSVEVGAAEAARHDLMTLWGRYLALRPKWLGPSVLLDPWERDAEDAGLATQLIALVGAADA